MAQKRMFDKAITNSDDFLELPDSTQVLYFHLSMNADDDGFVNNWKSIIKMTGTKEDDLKILIMKSFVIPFESGVLVIKHWRINNYLRNDRHKETNFVKEMAMLSQSKNGEYVLKTEFGIPNGNLDKNRIEENRIDKNSILIYEQTHSKDDSKFEQKDSKFEQEFEQLWNKYPNKKGKKDALKHYKAARKKGIDFETIDKGLDNYIEYLEHNPSKANYIKYGSSWFNQECWNDVYAKEETMDKLDIKLSQLEKWIEED